VQTQTPGQFPDPLDRIQFWTVGWQEVQREARSLFVSPGLVESRFVIVGVVADNYYAALTSHAGSRQDFEKCQESLGVESTGLLAIDKLSVAQPNGPKVTNAFAGGMVEQNGILDFRRHPHPAAGTVLLKMNFVQRPQVHSTVPYQFLKFFL
jgi:hypothetical protein